MSSRDRCAAWIVAVCLSTGWVMGQVPVNPIRTNFTDIQVVRHDAGCVWRDTAMPASATHTDGPRVRRTLFGFQGAVEAATTKCSGGLIQGEAFAWDATLNDSAAAASETASTSTIRIDRIRACSNPQPVVSINFSSSFMCIAKVDGAASHARAGGTLIAVCPEIDFSCPVGGSVESSSSSTQAGSVPVYGIPIPVFVSTAQGPQTKLCQGQQNKTRAGVTSATLQLSASVAVSTRADAMLGFFKTVAEAYVGAHVVAFEFTGHCNSCGGRIDVIRT